MKESDSFLIMCKSNYIAGITPANSGLHHMEGYQALVRIAKKYFDSNRLSEFSEFFQEGHYLVDLFAAHLILEYSDPPELLKTKALNIIKVYTDNPLEPEVAEQEKAWLLANYPLE